MGRRSGDEERAGRGAMILPWIDGDGWRCVWVVLVFAARCSNQPVGFTFVRASHDAVYYRELWEQIFCTAWSAKGDRGGGVGVHLLLAYRHSSWCKTIKVKQEGIAFLEPVMTESYILVQDHFHHW